MELGAIVAQKRVSRPKSVYSKDCISGSKGRWTLGFCMDSQKALRRFIINVSGSKHKKTIFHTSTLGAHKKSEKWAKCQYWDTCFRLFSL